MKKLLLATSFLVSLAPNAFAADTVLREVVLSSSGLGQYTFSAAVEGDTTLTLPVRRDQVNDVLKSLVVLDAKGTVGAVTLPGDDGLNTLFRSLPFDQNAFSSLVDFVQATRGQEVAVSGSSKASGKIMTLTPMTSRAPDGSVMTQHLLTLANESGLQQVILEQVATLKYADPQLNEAMTRALRGFAAQTNEDQRQVDINLHGDTKRNVAISYTIEAPVWKVAYRLRLADTDRKDEKGFLQGWAIVENTSPTDWKNVSLTLSSGSPVTYQQALYPSYFVQRPVLPLPIPNTITPRIDRGVMRDAREADESMTLQKSMRTMAAAPAPAMAMDMAASEEMAYGGANASFAGAQNLAMTSALTTQQSFTFPNKVSVAAGESLMMPFIAADISGQTLYLYQPDTNPEHPYASVAVKNDTDYALPPGIVTLYQSSQYVGDANIGAVPPGEERLVPFALDQETQISRETTHQPNVSKIAAAKGVLTLNSVQQQKNKYLIKGAAKKSRRIVIEEPKMAGWSLIQPDAKSVDETSTHYRITRDVAPGETATLETVLEYIQRQTIRLTDIDAETLVRYTTMGGEISKEAVAELRELAEKRRAVDAIDRRMADNEVKRQALFADQKRLRENLKATPEGSDLSKRYLKTLEEQENTLTDLAENTEQLMKDRAKAWANFADAVQKVQF